MSNFSDQYFLSLFYHSMCNIVLISLQCTTFHSTDNTGKCYVCLPLDCFMSSITTIKSESISSINEMETYIVQVKIFVLNKYLIGKNGEDGSKQPGSEGGSAKIKYLYHPLSFIQNPPYYLDAILWLPSSVMSFFLELWVRNFLSGTGSSTRHRSELK